MQWSYLDDGGGQRVQTVISWYVIFHDQVDISSTLPTETPKFTQWGARLKSAREKRTRA